MQQKSELALDQRRPGRKAQNGNGRAAAAGPFAVIGGPR
jgi:hypothetical protein